MAKESKLEEYVKYLTKIRDNLKPIEENITYMNPPYEGKEIVQGPESGETCTTYKAIVQLTRPEYHNAIKEFGLSTSRIQYRSIYPVKPMLEESISSLLPGGKRAYNLDLTFPDIIKEALKDVQIKSRELFII